MSSERLYNDEEVAAIIDKATRLEDRPASGGGSLAASQSGMTLAEIQKIGTEVGISPEVIAHSARSLTAGNQGATEVTRHFVGMPVGVGGGTDLPRSLTDREWEELVVQIRERFSAHGKLDQTGSLRSWRNGNLRVQLEPSANGQRLTLQTVKQQAMQQMMAGAGLLAGGGVLSLIGVAQGDADPLKGALILMVFGGAFLAVNAVSLRGWAVRRREQMEALMDSAVSIASRALPGQNSDADQLGAGASGPDVPGDEA